MEITEQQFLAYERVRRSGETNMFDIPAVITLADQMESVELDREECLYIMKNYSSLKQQYMGGQNE